MTERPFAAHQGEPGVLAAAPPAPLPGYYPDPSVPGFVRYWGGAAWVPGTSRPAPGPGEHLEPPRGVAQRPANLAAAAPPPPVVFPPATHPAAGRPGPFPGDSYARVDETGPMYFDETSGGASFVMTPFPAGPVTAQVPAPASAPTPASASAPAPVPVAIPAPASAATAGAAAGWQAAQVRPGERISWGAPRAVPAAPELSAPAPEAPSHPVAPAPAIPAPAASPVLAPASDPAPGSTVVEPAVVEAESVSGPTSPAPGPTVVRSARQTEPEGRRKPVTATAPARSAPAAPAAAAVSGDPARRASGAPRSRPAAPVPAGAGRRLTARLVDSLVLAVVAVSAGVPTVRSITVHLEQKVTAARAASTAGKGAEVQVWLVDGTVLGRIGVLLGVLLLAGLLYEVLPVSRTGRTFGKRLAGIKVITGVGAGTPPSFGRSVLRWLVRQLAVLSVVGLLAPVRDRKGRRGWHDRAAGTRVVRS
ncbi:RDD family protein [Kitasatospora sp. NPDC096147]|uniref:RDD family protein n=1 Tax=Kitasatospora sp. NPDC096147 TaxID=3364093 RepID=UPI00380E929B